MLLCSLTDYTEIKKNPWVRGCKAGRYAAFSHRSRLIHVVGRPEFLSLRNMKKTMQFCSVNSNVLPT